MILGQRIQRKNQENKYYLLGLSDTMTTIFGLFIVIRIEIDIVQNNGIGCR